MVQKNAILGWLSFAAGIFVVTSFALLPISTTYTDVFLALSILLMIASGNIKEKINAIIHNPIAVLFLAFFGLYLIGATYSSAPNQDIIVSLLKNSKLLYGALLIPLFFEEKWREYSLNILVLVISLIMVLSYLKIFGLLSITDRYQDSAVFKSHIQMNFLMAFLCYLLLGKCFENTSRGVKIFWCALLVLASLNTVMLSEGRTGYIIFAVLVTLFGWQRFSFKGLLVALLSVSLLCGSAFFFSSNFQERMVKVFSDTEQYQQGNAQTSVGLRISFYKNAFKLIREHPLIGSGTGSVITQYQTVEPNQALQTHNVHNEFLNVTIQLGFIGFCFLLYFFSTIYFKSYSLPQKYRDLAQAVVIAIAVGSLVNSWLMDTLEGHFFSMMIALCFSRVYNPASISARRDPITKIL